MPLPTTPGAHHNDDDETPKKKGLPTTPGQQKPSSLPKSPPADWRAGMKSIEEYVGKEEEAPTIGKAVVTNTEPEDSYISVGQMSSEELLEAKDDVLATLRDIIAEVVNWVQERLREEGLTDSLAMARAEGGSTRARVAKRIDSLILQHLNTRRDIRPGKERSYVIASVVNEIIGLGPLEPLWHDPRITEIMVNGPYDVQVEIEGKIRRVPGIKFRDREHLLDLCTQILNGIGRQISVRNPIEDGRLPDNSRVHIVHWALAPSGPNLTIRRHREQAWTVKELVARNSFTADMAKDLAFYIHSGCSTIVVGGTGTGKDLALDTKIPTPTGMTTMGEISVGDKVLNENGKPTKVIGVYPQPLNKCYEITFSDGTKVIAGREHNWLTSTHSSRRALGRVENIKEPRQRKQVMTEEERLGLSRLLSSKEPGALMGVGEVLEVSTRLRDIAYRYAKTQIAVAEGPRLYNAETFLTGLIAKGQEYVRDQRDKSATESVVTTEDIFNTLKTSTGHSNHAIKMLSEPVEYSQQELPIAPYVLGQWLGDGSSYGNRFENVDMETRDEFRKEGYWVSSENDAHCRVDDALERSGIRSALKSLGVLKHHKDDGETKFVPEMYIYSSIQQRRDILAGMLDSDGAVDKSGSMVTFTNTNTRLIDGFRQIAHSLGYQTRLTSKIPTYNYNGEKKEGKRAYTVSFSANHDVFRLTHKNEAHRAVRSEKQAGHRSNLRYITDVVEVPSVPTQCIEVDDPSHLFLCTESFIPTHNTTVLNALSGLTPFDERIVTIEDNLELMLHPDRLCAAPMEARPPGASGEGAITIRDLVKGSLRMRPNRIIVGEVRDHAAFDMLQAMNTGHNGSMTTIHANGADEAIPRLVNLVTQSGEINENGALSLIAGAVDILVVAVRFPEDGSRRLQGIYEVPSRTHSDDSHQRVLEPIPLWEFEQDGIDPETGKVVGHYEKKNEPSEALVKKHRLHRREKFTIEKVYELSDIPDEYTH